MFLAEKLRHMASGIRRPLTQTIWVGVNGFKGGAGATSMTEALSVVAACHGYRVGHVVADRDCHATPENKALLTSHPKITYFDTVESAISSHAAKGHFEFIFIDLPRDTFLLRGSEYQSFESILRQHLDIIVSPTDLSSGLSIKPLVSAYNMLNAFMPSHRRIIVQYALSTSISELVRNMHLLGDWQDALYDEAIPMELRPFELEEGVLGRKVRFRDSASSSRFYNLLSSVVEKVTGVAAMDEIDASTLPLPELLDALERQNNG
jgi:hypothetical protein